LFTGKNCTIHENEAEHWIAPTSIVELSVPKLQNLEEVHELQEFFAAELTQLTWSF